MGDKQNPCLTLAPMGLCMLHHSQALHLQRGSATLCLGKPSNQHIFTHFTDPGPTFAESSLRVQRQKTSEFGMILATHGRASAEVKHLAAMEHAADHQD